MTVKELVQALWNLPDHMEVRVGDGDNVFGLTPAAVSLVEDDDCGGSVVLIDLTDSSCEVLSGPAAG